MKPVMQDFSQKVRLHPYAMFSCRQSMLIHSKTYVVDNSDPLNLQDIKKALATPLCLHEASESVYTEQ